MGHYKKQEPIVVSDDEDIKVKVQNEQLDVTEACKQQVLNVLPDICPKHLKKLMLIHENNAERLIADVIDTAELGKPYPIRPRPSLKRKRGEEDEGVAGKVPKIMDYAQPRPGLPSYLYTETA